MPKPYNGPPTTLADDIRAMCLACQHSSVLSARELAARLGEGFAVRELIGRLRCHKCRSKDADVMVYQPSRGAVAGHDPSKATT